MQVLLCLVACHVLLSAITRALVHTTDGIIRTDHSSGILNINGIAWLPCEPDLTAHGQAWWTRRRADSCVGGLSPGRRRLRARLKIGLEYSGLAHIHLLVLPHVPQFRAAFDHRQGSGGEGKDGRGLDHRDLELMWSHTLRHLY